MTPMKHYKNTQVTIQSYINVMNIFHPKMNQFTMVRIFIKLHMDNGQEYPEI